MCINWAEQFPCSQLQYFVSPVLCNGYVTHSPHECGSTLDHQQHYLNQDFASLSVRGWFFGTSFCFFSFCFGILQFLLIFSKFRAHEVNGVLFLCWVSSKECETLNWFLFNTSDGVGGGVKIPVWGFASEFLQDFCSGSKSTELLAGDLEASGSIPSPLSAAS